MHIVLFDASPWLVDALRATGNTVTACTLPGGVLSVAHCIPKGLAPPDVVVQQEHLSRRTFLSDLEALPCPTLFWAIDSHLNMFWHQYYGRLFDAVLTPHVSLFDTLPAFLKPPVLQRFMQSGERRMWRPHGQREHGLSFWGRQSAQRPIRGWMCDILQHFGLHAVDDLDYAGMMALYDASRVVPNESIAHEVNFRLMEGTSAGCLVLSPDIGADQNALFEPGVEFLEYRDGAELLEHVAWAQRTPKAAEAIARRGYARIGAEHLPEHRAATFLAVVGALTSHRLRGCEAQLAWWLTLVRLIRIGVVPIDGAVHAAQGLQWAEASLARVSPLGQYLQTEVRTQALYLYAEHESAACQQYAEHLAQVWMAESRGWVAPQNTVISERMEDDGVQKALQKTVPVPMEGKSPPVGATLGVCGAGSFLALRQEKLTQAKAFWVHYGGKGHVPESPVELALAWAKVYERAHRVVQPGFGYTPASRMLPECAHEQLLLACCLEPAHNKVHHALAELLAPLRSHLSIALTYLAQGSLYQQQNWRLQCNFAIASVQACRVEAGLAELECARRKAEEQGRLRLFESMLAARDRSGAIRRLLACHRVQAPSDVRA